MPTNWRILRSGETISAASDEPGSMIDKSKYVTTKYKEFTDKEVYEYEKSLLSNKFLDYRLKTQEFFDGIWYFECTFFLIEMGGRQLEM